MNALLSDQGRVFSLLHTGLTLVQKWYTRFNSTALWLAWRVKTACSWLTKFLWFKLGHPESVQSVLSLKQTLNLSEKFLLIRVNHMHPCDYSLCMTVTRQAWHMSIKCLLISQCALLLHPLWQLIFATNYMQPFHNFTFWNGYFIELLWILAFKKLGPIHCANNLT